MTYYNVDVFFKKMTLGKITIDNSVGYVKKTAINKVISKQTR